MAKNVIINGVTYNDVPYVDMPQSGGGTASFYDTSDATGVAADTLAGKDVYGVSGKQSGSMPENGDTSGTISTKNGSVTIPAGHTSGGTVQLSSEAKAAIIADNIKAGATILGQAGKSTVIDTELASGAASEGTILAGSSAFVNGRKVDGTATVPTVSQDSSTKVLTIA